MTELPYCGTSGCPWGYVDRVEGDLFGMVSLSAVFGPVCYGDPIFWLFPSSG